MRCIINYCVAATFDVISCGLVCKDWHRISLDPSLWHTVDLTGKIIKTR